MTIPGHLEAAPTADLADDPLSMTWVDLTSRTRQNSVTVKRGRNTAAVGAAPPSTMSGVVLDNGDHALTPRNPTSTYYPGLRRGTRVRHWVALGDPYLELTGLTNSRATTPDAAALDVTGDLYMAVQFRCPVHMPISNALIVAGQDRYQIIAKYNSSTNNRSYYLAVNNHGDLVFFWSTDGTNPGVLSASSSLALPRPDSGRLTAAMHIDVNNGASGHTVRFWAHKGTITETNTALTANETLLRLGDPFIGSGTTSIFAGNAALEIGDITGTGDNPYPGGIEAAQARSGDWTGTVVANPDFTTQPVGDTGLTDSAGRVWTYPALVDRYTTMTGEIAAIDPEYPGHGVTGTNQVTWDVQGILGRMRQGEQPIESALFRLVTAPINIANVLGYWPMEDGSAASSAASGLPGGSRMRVTGSGLRFAADSSLNSSKPVTSWSSGAASWSGYVPTPGVAITNWAYELFFFIGTPETAPAQTYLQVVNTTGHVNEWRIAIHDTSVNIGASRLDPTSATGFANVTGFPTSFAADPRMFNTWAIVRISETDNGANVDWAVNIIPIPLGVAFGTSGSFAGTFGRPTYVRNLTNVPPDGLSIAHQIVTFDRSIGWLAPADTAYVGEPAAQRAFRLGREQGTSVLVDGPYGLEWDPVIAAGAQTMGPQLPRKFTDLLDECARVDNGILYESRELLGLAYRSGSTMLNQTPVITVTDEVVPPFKPSDDDRYLVNDATVTRQEGSDQHYVNQQSIDDEGRYVDSRTINSETDEQALNHASWWVHEATRPEMRLDKTTLELAKNDGVLTADWANVNPGDLVRLDDPPAGWPTETIDQVLDGWDVTISPHLWTIAANGRPDAGQVGVLDDNTPTVALARLDIAGGAALSVAVDDDDTSLTIPGGQTDWIDSGSFAAQFPFDAILAGERMTVTAAVWFGAWVFTVTRSVNGVVKSHDIGTAVELANPIRLTL